MSSCGAMDLKNRGVGYYCGSTRNVSDKTISSGSGNGRKILDHTTFPLRAIVEHHAQFIHSRVDHIDPERQQIFIDGAVLPYDIL